MRSRRLAIALAVVAGGAVLAPLIATPSQAAWTGNQWAYGPAISTSSTNCVTDTGYASTASGQFLSGSLLTTDLDNVAGVQGIRVGMDAAGTATPTPAAGSNGSTELDVMPPTYEAPLNVSALGGALPILNVSNLSAGLTDAGDLGALGQWAQTSGTGTAAGAAGLVTSQGGVDTQDTSGASGPSMPTVATLDLSGILGSAVTSAVADVKAEIGAVSASSQINGCAALESALWGTAPSPAQRAYQVSGLGLDLSAPSLGTVATQVGDTLGTVSSTVNSLEGLTGTLDNSVLGLVTGELGALGLNAVLDASATNSLTITLPNLQTALGTLLTAPLTDGVVTINVSTGDVYVDLTPLLGGADGLNDLAPNTELDLNAAVVSSLVARITTLLNGWTTNITSTLLNAIDSAPVTGGIGIAVNVLGGLYGGINVANVGLSAPAGTTLGGILSGATPLSTSTSEGTSTLLGTVLSLLGININSLLSGLLGTLTNATAAVQSALKTGLIAPITALGSTLSGITGPVISGAGSALGALPGVLSLMVNVEPDQPCPSTTGEAVPAWDPSCGELASASAYTRATADSTAQYLETALRVSVLDGGAVSALSLATASAGPVTLPSGG
ncbi:choice-of-anchor G family protein [Gryllotalpicola reticulitermitis]|uniref:Choice-of-anchor G family protein n=1 Tax=Gryllotalpicola reticulitermitis TaxID=1184153 RepID=A0ABV8Q4G0_9MICO